MVRWCDRTAGYVGSTPSMASPAAFVSTCPCPYAQRSVVRICRRSLRAASGVLVRIGERMPNTSSRPIRSTRLPPSVGYAYRSMDFSHRAATLALRQRVRFATWTRTAACWNVGNSALRISANGSPPSSISTRFVKAPPFRLGQRHDGPWPGSSVAATAADGYTLKSGLRAAAHNVQMERAAIAAPPGPGQRLDRGHGEISRRRPPADGLAEREKKPFPLIFPRRTRGTGGHHANARSPCLPILTMRSWV